MSQSIAGNDYQEPFIHLSWSSNEKLNLTEDYDVTIPNAPGTLVVYSVPDFVHEGRTRYESFYNLEDIEQRPGCSAELWKELLNVVFYGPIQKDTPDDIKPLKYEVTYCAEGLTPAFDSVQGHIPTTVRIED